MRCDGFLCLDPSTIVAGLFFGRANTDACVGSRVWILRTSDGVCRILVSLDPFVDLAVTVVVFAIAFGFGGLIVVVVAIISDVAAIFPLSAFTGLFGALASAVLFGAWLGGEVVVDLAVAVVVESIALGFGAFVGVVVGFVAVVIALQPFSLLAITELGGALADAILFIARGRFEVVVDLAVTIVVDTIASFGCFALIVFAFGPFAADTFLCACFAGGVACVGASGCIAFASVGSAKARPCIFVDAIAVFVGGSVAIVVFAVTLAFGALVIGVVACVGVVVAVDPLLVFAVAGLFDSVADAVLFGAKWSGEVVIDLTVAVVVETIAQGFVDFVGAVAWVFGSVGGVCGMIAIFPTVDAVTGLFGTFANTVLFFAQGGFQIVVDFVVAIVV